ncbi:MAG: leader peptidase (prepilin peptidase) / N-methyltransferase [Candidatus Parcubacteria bacterium]|jgi:prepilin signal peptidase PulO-like enzyme (type II secretory pathway)|nr:leader peptidase (prepilin peptidase) / N-methyltransferase [Candidatus Parcubacteria bacterium]
MDALSLILSFIFGTAVGSFLNVVALRFNSGAGIGGRSKCMSCGNQLSWKELVPLLSFALQSGACRKCQSKISRQYPLVEFAAGAIFVLIFFRFPPVSIAASLETVIYIFATCLLIVISAYDIKHKIIPDPFVYCFALVAFISLFVGGATWWHIPGWTALLAGPLLALPFALLWLVSKGAWMGLGDAKLVLGIGWFLGPNGGVNAVILAFWIAAAVSLLWLLAKRRKFQPKTEVPFGPYLILGLYLVLFWRIEIIDLHLIKELIFQTAV